MDLREHSIGKNIRNILGITHSYQKSFTVIIACQLKIFTYMHEKALSLEDIADLCEIKNKKLFGLFMDACVEIGLLAKSGKLYRNSSISNELLSENSPSYIGDIILLSLDYSKHWRNLSNCLKDGDSNAKYQLIVDKLSEEEISRYTKGMHALSNLLGPEIVKATDLTYKKQLLDIGGGSGGYSILFANQNKNLNINILELGPVANYTKEIVLRSNLADRIKVIAGDIFKSDIPSDNDVVFISNIIHWYEQSDNMEILSKAYNSMSKGGLIIIHDFMDEIVQYMGFALFSFSRCLVTRQARAYHYDEVYSWLNNLKFKDIRITALDNFARTTLITARK